ncbi:T9SS type A sorting domain-containing protein [Flammeovirga agarivorans]|uniref:T9SS type A sorting domain-containing protein n=1 Tax=Flammeovirga agarivorans TaxID=2726742 RepID=A0A7X8SKL2_9BACT|nr:T9SS type A sorting domain-containing protein [Flammeovirga agarivorans]NLR91959.1 T9SS type A sorting domain-containing protein [Flammeovirga agarivorans]
MKKIFYISIVLILSAFTSALAQQDVASITVKCPPCRPIASCDQCFENQTAADEACGSSARTIGTSLESELSDYSINVFPNPSKQGKFTVESINNLEGHVQLFSPVGDLIEEFDVSDQKMFNVGTTQSLPSGVYIMTYTDKEGNTVTKKLVVSF